MRTALDADGGPDEDGTAGPAVSGWFAELRTQITATVLTGIWAIATARLGLPAA